MNNGRKATTVPPAELELYKAGEMDIDDLARALRVSELTARRALARAGVEVRSRRRGPSRPAFQLPTAEFWAYQSGQKTRQEIAASLGVSETTVHRAMVRAGADADLAATNRAARKRQGVPAVLVEDLREGRLSVGTLAKQLHRGRDSVLAELRRLGVDTTAAGRKRLEVLAAARRKASAPHHADEAEREACPLLETNDGPVILSLGEYAA